MFIHVGLFNQGQKYDLLERMLKKPPEYSLPLAVRSAKSLNFVPPKTSP